MTFSILPKPKQGRGPLRIYLSAKGIHSGAIGGVKTTTTGGIPRLLALLLNRLLLENTQRRQTWVDFAYGLSTLTPRPQIVVDLAAFDGIAPSVIPADQLALIRPFLVDASAVQDGTSCSEPQHAA